MLHDREEIGGKLRGRKTLTAAFVLCIFPCICEVLESDAFSLSPNSYGNHGAVYSAQRRSLASACIGPASTCMNNLACSSPPISAFANCLRVSCCLGENGMPTHLNARQGANENVPEDGECHEWKSGDFASDLKKLESAVALLNAQTDLDEKERLQLLDEFARQRRELIPDAVRYIFKPSLMAIALSMITTSLKNSIGTASNRIHLQMKFILAITHQAMNLSFWTITVLMPLAIHFKTKKSRRASKREGRTRINEFEARFVDPDTDCSDYSRCLLENWCLAICPSTIIGLLSLLRPKLQSQITSPLWGVWNIIVLASKLVTRIGAAMAIHQFPMYQYKLRIADKKRPTPFLPMILKILTDLSLRVLPLAFASDVVQLHTACATQAQMRNLDYLQQLKSSVVALPHFMKGDNSIIGGYNFSHGCTWNLAAVSTFIVYFVAALYSFLTQLCEFVAFQRLFRIGRFSNISLSTDSAKIRKMLDDDPDALDSSVKLRYRLNWREPKRLFPSFQKVYKDFLLFVFTGWGEEAAIWHEKKEKVEPYLLRLVRRDMEKNPNTSKPDREQWIPDAFTSMASIHQKSYENKSMEDPLGVALQQTFGIGLCFDFDHGSALEKGEEPSVHRLRARAAKSAIKQYNQIPNKIKLEQESKEMPNMTAKEKDEMICGLIEEEKENFACRVRMNLTNLIPTNAPAPEGKDLEIWSMRQSEAAIAQGAANLPFLEHSFVPDNDDDSIVTDPYLGDDIFSNDKGVFT